MRWLVRLAVIATIVGLGGVLTACAPDTSPAAQLEPSVRLSAKEAWAVMEAEVMEWKPGSQINIIRVPSRPGREDLDVDGRSSAWRFFVAPEGDTMQGIYSIDTTIAPIRVHRTEQTRPLSPAPLDPAGWVIDSPAAMQTAVDNGLQDWFDSQPDFRIGATIVELIGTADHGTHWRIEAQDGAHSFTIRISASDGSVLETVVRP